MDGSKVPRVENTEKHVHVRFKRNGLDQYPHSVRSFTMIRIKIVSIFGPWRIGNLSIRLNHERGYADSSSTDRRDAGVVRSPPTTLVHDLDCSGMSGSPRFPDSGGGRTMAV